ncbi:MAG: hypothetical protein GF355_15695 [Candidatus Eisenbacteria bacterium]|nr:hypothetical protein [Candidatus Eisenbacteria bacterium]
MLGFENLAPLDEAMEGHYEGWAIIGGNPVSTGKFNVNEAGEPVELGGGPVIEEFDAGEDITGASDIVITLEPPGDGDELPSDIKLLAAPVENAQADLKLNVPDREVLETMTTGQFILATPSDNPEFPDNDDMGIWYLVPPDPDPGFQDLPEIGPNWIYEGWVVDVSDPNNPVPYSTGTFETASGHDSDEAGCNGGGPPFPGQDFVEAQCPPYLELDTGDFATVISIEPVPDNLPAPFQVKPLAGPIPEDGVGETHDVMNQAAETFPTGLAELYMQETATDQISWGEVKTKQK